MSLSRVVDCAKEGKLRELESMLAGGANPNRRAYFVAGNTPLQVAVESGNGPCVGALLRHGADPNVRSNLKCAPLKTASFKGFLDIVRLLTAAGASVNAATSRGLTALHVAAEGGHIDVARHLIERGADLNAHRRGGVGVPLVFAVSGNHLRLMRFLLQSGADVDGGSPDCGTALCYAESPEVARELIDYGADPNAEVEVQHYRPLHAHHSRPSVLRVLLENGADVNAREITGCTPLLTAASACCLESVRILLEYGADPCVRDFRGCTSIETAKGVGAEDIANLIKEWCVKRDG